MIFTHLELLVLDTRVIFPYSLGHQDTILRRKTRGAHRTVGEPPGNKYTPNEGQGTKQL